MQRNRFQIIALIFNAPCALRDISALTHKRTKSQPVKAKKSKSSCKMKPLRSKVKVKSLKMNKNVSNRKDKVVSDLISEISKNKKGCQINVFN